MREWVGGKRDGLDEVERSLRSRLLETLDDDLWRDIVMAAATDDDFDVKDHS